MLPFLGPVLGIIEKFVPDSDKQLELQKEIEKNRGKLEAHFAEYARNDHELRLKELTHTGYKAWWRPAAMGILTLLVSLHLLFNYVMPQVIVQFNLNMWYKEPTPLPEIVWYVYMGCMLGLGALRTYDKRR